MTLRARQLLQLFFFLSLSFSLIDIKKEIAYRFLAKDSLSLSTSFFLFHLSFAFSLLFDDIFFFLNDKKKTPSLSYETSSPFGSTRAIRVREYNNETREKKKTKEKKKHVAEIGVDFTLIYLPRSSSIPLTTEYKIFSVAVLTTQGVVTYTLRWKNRIDEIRFCARSFIKCARQLRKKIPSLSLDCCSTSPIFFYRILDSNLLRH